MSVAYTTHTITFNKLPLLQGVDALYVNEATSIGVYPNTETVLTAKNKNSFHVEVYDSAVLSFRLDVSNGYQLSKIQVGGNTVPLTNGTFVVENVKSDITVNIITAPSKYNLSWSIVNANLQPITPDFEMRLSINKGTMRGDNSLEVSFGDKVTFYPSGTGFYNNYHVVINGIQYSWDSFGANVSESGGSFTWTYEIGGSDTTILFVKN